MNKETNNKKTMGEVRFIIDLVLWIFLMVLVIIAYSNGHFIHKEVKIIEVCNGNPTGQKYLNSDEVPNNITIPQEIKQILQEQKPELRYTIKSGE